MHRICLGRTEAANAVQRTNRVKCSTGLLVRRVTRGKGISRVAALTRWKCCCWDLNQEAFRGFKLVPVSKRQIETVNTRVTQSTRVRVCAKKNCSCVPTAREYNSFKIQRRLFSGFFPLKITRAKIIGLLQFPFSINQTVKQMMRKLYFAPGKTN